MKVYYLFLMRRLMKRNLVRILYTVVALIMLNYTLKTFFLILPVVAGLRGIHGTNQRYEANWESLDSRPLPAWYDEAKIGIFIHWGVFSVPSFGSEWFWYYWQHNKQPEYVELMKKNYRPGFTYQDFGPQFTAEMFNPKKWAELFSRAGAQYVVLTSKHHEGYTLWPSSYSYSWNAMDVGPHKDLVGELATAIRSLDKPLRFGLYHSLYEWFHPLYLSDKASNFEKREFVEKKTMPGLIELVKAYKPDVVWSDGDWEAPDKYWGSEDFLAWLFNESPVKEDVVVNDRWGKGTRAKHGSFFNGEDRFNPKTAQAHKWENCMTLDKHSWGYNRNAAMEDYFTIEELLKVMAETISCGGNLLVNVGPTKDGLIPPIMEERLVQMGQWLKINGDAIYASNVWDHQKDTNTPGIWYTQNSTAGKVYAIVLSWPIDEKVVLANVIPTPTTKVYMKGYDQPLETRKVAEGFEISFPPLSKVTSKWSWVLEMSGVKAKQ